MWGVTDRLNQNQEFKDTWLFVEDKQSGHLGVKKEARFPNVEKNSRCLSTRILKKSRHWQHLQSTEPLASGMLSALWDWQNASVIYLAFGIFWTTSPLACPMGHVTFSMLLRKPFRLWCTDGTKVAFGGSEVSECGIFRIFILQNIVIWSDRFQLFHLLGALFRQTKKKVLKFRPALRKSASHVGRMLSMTKSDPVFPWN